MGLVFQLCTAVAAGSGGMVVTIVSQGDAYHSARAGEKREQWLEQLSSSAQHEVRIDNCVKPLKACRY